MRLNAAVNDIWVFRRGNAGIEFLLLYTSQIKADRYFNGGRFWQIPSGIFQADESVPAAVDRELAPYGLNASAIWAAEHTYTIYNRRFHEIQIISVFAAEVERASTTVSLDPEEHSEFAWLDFDEAFARVHFRGLKDGLSSVRTYITAPSNPAAELRLR